MNILWYPREHLSETPTKKAKEGKLYPSCHAKERRSLTRCMVPSGSDPPPPNHNTHKRAHTHTHMCTHMHTLLDIHSGLPLACAEPSCGHLCVPPVDILRPMGTWLSKQTMPLCEGKGTSSSTWTQASARALALASVAWAWTWHSFPGSAALCHVQTAQLSWCLLLTEPFWTKCLNIYVPLVQRRQEGWKSSESVRKGQFHVMQRWLVMDAEQWATATRG